MVTPLRSVAAVILASLALAACSNLGSGLGGSGGGEGKELIIASELPLQGSSEDASESVNNAMKLYLEQIGYKAGNHRIKFQSYDNSTPSKGQWDAATCARNARDHLSNAAEVAIIGPENSGCAEKMIPEINRGEDPLLMVSHANTGPGLTKKWGPGEPGKYYPSAKRNYARVVTTDDYQGVAAAQFAAQKLGVERVYVLHDNETFGQGVAKVFQDEARRQGIKVIANEPWDNSQRSYTALFTKIKATNPDLIYLGGIYDNNGGQLIRDKVAVLGSNSKVKLMGPDGFTGYPELDKLPQGQGMFLTFAGLSPDQLRQAGGAAAKFLDDYEAKYNAPPSSSYALYSVAALQVVLAAVERSDGTRAGVLRQVFEGDGITVPAERSAISKPITIDPATGDTSNKDISILIIKDGAETFVQALPVS